MLLYLECLQNNKKFTIINFTTNCYKNYFMQILGYQVLLTQITWSQLTPNSINSIAKYVSLDLNMTFWVYK